MERICKECNQPRNINIFKGLTGKVCFDCRQKPVKSRTIRRQTINRIIKRSGIATRNCKVCGKLPVTYFNDQRMEICARCEFNYAMKADK